MALLTLWSASAGPVLAAVHAGDPAPDFRGTDLGGVSRRLSDYHGKVVVLFVLGST
jgi:hypothetical protein